jgi:predicted DNA-binding transcriptional regulator YafY
VHAGKRRLKLKCFELVAKATLERKQIRIQHFNRQTGVTVERIISPQQMVHYRDNWYVDAWCHLRKEVRSFAVDAITECDQLIEDAKELDADQLRTSMQSGYGIFGGAVRGWAKLKFSPGRARWVKQEEWHEAQKGRELADGSYILEIPYSDERELLGDILRFGSDVQVISPNSLRNQVLTELKNSSAAYQSGISLGSDLTP